MEEKNTITNNALDCGSCGATLHFKPGTRHLKCDYCGATNEIASDEPVAIHSFDYEEFIKTDGLPVSATREANVVQCSNCGAQTALPQGITADTCAFCNSPLVISKAHHEHILKPHYVLPFLLDDREAENRFRRWLGNLWFAPNALIKNVKQIHRDHFKGIYLPHWAYDAQTTTHYTGQCGIHYWITESYTTTENGRSVQRSRQVRRTRWHPVSGTVSCTFNDVLVLASNSLKRGVADKLEPWQLTKLLPFDERFLSGFRSETYRIDAQAGLQFAKQKMEPIIVATIRSDIGGDEQLINSNDSKYFDIKLKYNLLPIWITAFRFKAKVYQIAINASTGEVIGERPYSVTKIVFAVIGALILLAILLLLVQG